MKPYIHPGSLDEALLAEAPTAEQIAVLKRHAAALDKLLGVMARVAPWRTVDLDIDLYGTSVELRNHNGTPCLKNGKHVVSGMGMTPLDAVESFLEAAAKADPKDLYGRPS